MCYRNQFRNQKSSESASSFHIRHSLLWSQINADIRHSPQHMKTMPKLVGITMWNFSREKLHNSFQRGVPSPKLCILKIDDFVNFHFVTIHFNEGKWLQTVFTENTVGEQNPLAAEKLTSIVITYLLGGPSSLFKLRQVPDLTWLELEVFLTRSRGSSQVSCMPLLAVIVFNPKKLVSNFTSLQPCPGGAQ